MKQHELLRHIADNIEAGRSDLFGLVYSNGNEIREPIDFYCPYKYKVKPETVVINEIEVERGVTVEPVKGKTYFTPVVTNDTLCGSVSWRGDEYDKGCFCRGLVFLEKEKAVAMTKAMLSFKK